MVGFSRCFLISSRRLGSFLTTFQQDRNWKNNKKARGRASALVWVRLGDAKLLQIDFHAGPGFALRLGDAHFLFLPAIMVSQWGHCKNTWPGALPRRGAQKSNWSSGLKIAGLSSAPNLVTLGPPKREWSLIQASLSYAAASG